MINSVTAQQFLNRLGKTMNYPVNITNTQGTILASTLSDHIGEYRRGAHELIRKKLPVSLVSESAGDAFSPHSSSVFYPIFEDGEIAGVVEVVGNPDETQEIAKTVKIAFETLASEENHRDRPARNLFGGDLARVLLFDSVENPALIRRISQNYKYEDNRARLPILIQGGLAQDFTQLKSALFKQYSTLSIYHSQDIILELGGERILLFKHMSDISINCRFIADEVVNCLDEFFLSINPKTDIQNIFYFYGPIQLLFVNYASVYQCICWMERHLRMKTDHINRFSSYLPEFLLKNISENTLRPIFDASIYRIENLWDLDSFMETVASLISANMKLDPAAKLLHMHKNTVVFRLNKIKEVLGLDPINYLRDANYLIMLYNYWKYYYYSYK